MVERITTFRSTSRGRFGVATTTGYAPSHGATLIITHRSVSLSVLLSLRES